MTVEILQSDSLEEIDRKLEQIEKEIDRKKEERFERIMKYFGSVKLEIGPCRTAKKNGEMNGSNALIDSNILIYFLLGRIDVQKFFRKYECSFSFITELEVLSGIESDKLQDAKEIMSEYQVIEYLPATKNLVINIRSKKKIKLADAIIAATAIYLKCPLISSDKDFFWN